MVAGAWRIGSFASDLGTSTGLAAIDRWYDTGVTIPAQMSLFPYIGVTLAESGITIRGDASRFTTNTTGVVDGGSFDGTRDVPKNVSFATGFFDNTEPTRPVTFGRYIRGGNGNLFILANDTGFNFRGSIVDGVPN